MAAPPARTDRPSRSIHDRIDEAPGECLRGIDRCAGQGHVSRALAADSTRDADATASAGYQPESDLRQLKKSIAACMDAPAEGRQLGTGADARAVHPEFDSLDAPQQHGPGQPQATHRVSGGGIRRGTEFVEITPGAEARAVARQPVSYTHLTLPTNREV